MIISMHAPTVEVPRRLELPDRPGPEVLKNVLGQMAAFWKTEYKKTRVTTNRKISVVIKTQKTSFSVALEELVCFVHLSSKEDLQVTTSVLTPKI